jgi:hypothetical protein
MARSKETISQVDFSFGETRPEAVERDDLPLVAQAVKSGRNTLALTPGAIEGRPGTLHIGETAAKYGTEVDLGANRVFDVHIVEDGVVIYGEDGATVASFLSSRWDDLPGKYGADTFSQNEFWMFPDPDTSSILLGSSSYPTHALVIDPAGVWSFGLFSYEASQQGALQQPYWPYFADVSITPSAQSGAITVTVSQPIFTAAFEGIRIRYVDREIVLGTLISATEINATVSEELPPTYRFTVASGSGYQVGDAVEHETLGGQGRIVSVSGNRIDVVATVLWDGFTSSEKLVGPNASQEISAQATINPGPSFLWDMQMANPIHGYPGWGTKHQGRAYFCRYPNAPNAFAVSAAGRIDDFGAGAEDADGFVETLGADLGGNLLYMISAEDLLFFTTRGLYYQDTRAGEDVTPRTIRPNLFSRMGCSETVPVAVDDGAIFVDAAGQQIYAAVLAGDYYRSWAARHISQYHSHLLNSPRFLGATKFGSSRPEHFVYVINADGTAAVCQWDRAENKVGWRPWVTAGQFQSIYQAFGDVWAVVDRADGSFTGRFRERFQQGVYLDCTCAVQVDQGSVVSLGVAQHFGALTKYPVHLVGARPAMFFENWDLGDADLDAAGVPLLSDGLDFSFPTYDGFAQFGLPFLIEVTPWSRRSVNTQRGARDIKRVIQTFITVQDTLQFEYQDATFGGYRAGDDLSVPPSLRSEEFRVANGGRSHYQDRPITVTRPGPFRLLKLRYRVTV